MMEIFMSLPINLAKSTVATDLPAICYVLGDLADGHPMVIKIKAMLKQWGINPEDFQ